MNICIEEKTHVFQQRKSGFSSSMRTRSMSVSALRRKSRFFKRENLDFLLIADPLIALFLPKSLNILHGLFLADHLDEFDVENEGAVGRDIARGRLLSISFMWRNNHPSLSSHFHAFDSFFKTWNDISLSQHHLKR